MLAVVIGIGFLILNGGALEIQAVLINFVCVAAFCAVGLRDLDGSVVKALIADAPDRGIFHIVKRNAVSFVCFAVRTVIIRGIEQFVHKLTVVFYGNPRCADRSVDVGRHKRRRLRAFQSRHIPAEQVGVVLGLAPCVQQLILDMA